MTQEQLLESVLLLFNRFKAQGAEVVYAVRAQGRYFLGLKAAQRIRGSSEAPTNHELRTEDDVRAWLG